MKVKATGLQAATAIQEADVLHESTAAAATTGVPPQLGLLLIDEEPTTLALYRRDDNGAGQVVAWVLVLPNGDALLVFADQPAARPVVTTLSSVRRRWADLMDAELVQVAGRRALRLAS
jgi:hypothetical protein